MKDVALVFSWCAAVAFVLLVGPLGCDAICDCREPEPCPEPPSCPEPEPAQETGKEIEFRFDHDDGYRGFPWGTVVADIRRLDPDLVGCTDVTPVEDQPTFYMQCKSRTAWDATIRYIFEKVGEELSLISGSTTVRGMKDDEVGALIWAMFEKYGPLPPGEGEDLRFEWESARTAIWINDVPGGFTIGYFDLKYMRRTMGKEDVEPKNPELSRKIATELRL